MQDDDGEEIALQIELADEPQTDRDRRQSLAEAA